MNSTLTTPAQPNVVRDASGKPVACLICVTRLATSVRTFATWDCPICDDCDREREARMTRMESMEPVYRCMGCGEEADLGIHGIGEDGEGRPFLATDCCGDMYIRPNGTILEEDPRATEDW